jgi:squalene-associated FAD-dependent desaturase
MNVAPSGKSVAVVGGGWSGCAAAVALAGAGARVTLFEAARTLGGRARCVPINGKKLDNGQHILLGAYTETLRLMDTVGLAPDDALLRLPVQMRYPKGRGGIDFLAPRLPAPFHMLIGLLRARGFGRGGRLALARFFTTARWMEWRLNTDCSVAELLERFDQPERLIRFMWRPLCIAALNTPPERASASVFLNVLRDSLGARGYASDMLIPREDLTSLLPQRAAEYVERHGGTVRYGAHVRNIEADGARWRIEAGDGAASPTDVFDGVIIATQPWQAVSLLDKLGGSLHIPQFDYESITTCYLQYDSVLKLAQPFHALIDDPAAGDWGQFVFDRGHLDPDHAGLFAVVISASREALELVPEALARAVAGQLAAAFDQPAFLRPAWTKVISEKRATFSCTPGLRRPANATAMPGLAIAGDYTAGDYPATLEAAARSGVQAARVLIG